MKDRFTRGFLSGVMAGIPTLTFFLIASSMKWTTIRWAHFASIFIFGHKYLNLMENVFATLATFLFCGLMGVVFALIIPKISGSNYLLKAWVYSTTIWFFSFTITYLFKVPELLSIPLKSAISNFVGASIWGLSLGYCLKWSDNKLKT